MYWFYSRCIPTQRSHLQRRLSIDWGRFCSCHLPIDPCRGASVCVCWPFVVNNTIGLASVLTSTRSCHTSQWRMAIHCLTWLLRNVLGWRKLVFFNVIGLPNCIFRSLYGSLRSSCVCPSCICRAIRFRCILVYTFLCHDDSPCITVLMCWHFVMSFIFMPSSFLSNPGSVGLYPIALLTSSNWAVDIFNLSCCKSSR